MEERRSTADLFDAAGGRCQSCGTQFRQFGGRRAFFGRIHTVQCRDDNLLVRRLLETEGNGSVVVVDGGGSLGSALLGDKLAELAARHGWTGIVIFGAVRDSAALANVPVGVKALGTNPRRSAKLGVGQMDVPVTFGGATFTPGHWLYSDDDGILVTDEPLA